MASSYYDSSGKNVVDGDVAYAADLNDINVAADTGFQLVEAAVDAIAANQSFYSDLAEKWAESPEDTAVTPGKYSALHWAAKSEDQAVLAEADKVQTGLDRIATAADRVQTGQDKVATAADRVQTGLDKVATAADRVQTGLDVISSDSNADRAEAAAALMPIPVSGDEGKVMTVADPFSDGFILEDIIVSSGRKNYLINGSFDIWQRATSQTSSGYGSDDRWYNTHLGSTKTASRQSFTIGQTDVPENPTYFSRTVVSTVAGAGNYCQKQQRIEDVTKLSGKTVTVSFYAKADSVKNIAVELTQYFGSGGSPSAVVNVQGQKISLSASWVEKTITFSVPSVTGKTLGSDNNSSTLLTIWFDAGSSFNSRTDTLGQQSGTFDIAQVQLEEGDTATEFERRTIGDELQLCYRYYENLVDGVFGVAAGTSMFLTGGFKVEKRAQPVMSSVGNLRVTDYLISSSTQTSPGGLTTQNANSKGFFLLVTGFGTSLTTGNTIGLQGPPGGSGYITADSEL